MAHSINLQYLWAIFLLSLLSCSREAFPINNDLEIQIHSPTMIGIAEAITMSAAYSTRFQPATTNQFICTTWIFPLSRNTAENSQEFNKEEGIQFPVKFPRLIISLQSFIELGLYASNFSYKGYEFTDEDIINPVKHGIQRYGINCASIFIDLRNTEDIAAVESMIKQLYAMKLARQHKDYFIFIRNTGGHSMDLLNHGLIAEQRFKYLISVDNNHSKIHVINTCALPSEHLALYSRKCNSVLNSRYLRASCTAVASIIRPDSTSTLKPLNGGGFVYYMFQEAARRFNFTSNVILAGYNGATGLKKEINGKLVWIGAVGEVFSSKADITLGAGLTLERNHVIDSTVMHTWYTRVFYVKSPNTRSSWLSILWPLDIYVWITLVIIAGLILTPTYYAAAVLYFRFAARNIDEYVYKGWSHCHWRLLTQVIDAIFRVLLEQSATVRSWTATVLRFLLILWAITCLILETAYRCKLVVFLSFAIKEDYPKTHSKLASYATLSNLQPNYKLYFRYFGGAAYNAYKKSNNPMHATILKNSYLVNSSVDCLEAVLNSNTATNSQPVACLDFEMNSEYTILRNFTLPNSGSLNLKTTDATIAQLFIRSTDTDFKFIVGWNLRKGSRWTESFDSILLSYFANGLYDFWILKDWMITRKGGIECWKQLEQEKEHEHHPDSVTSQQQLGSYKTIKTLMDNSMSKGPKSINTQNLKGLFLICGIGLSISIVSFVVEFLSKIQQILVRDN